MTTLIPKYDQGATGAVNRPINLKLAEQVSVLDFGADPTGVADSTTAFTNAQKIYPVQDLTKIQIYNLLPQDVRDMTWSCRTPIYNTDGVPSVCNQCKACIEMKSIKTTLIYNSEIAKYL